MTSRLPPPRSGRAIPPATLERLIALAHRIPRATCASAVSRAPLPQPAAMEALLDLARSDETCDAGGYRAGSTDRERDRRRSRPTVRDDRAAHLARAHRAAAEGRGQESKECNHLAIRATAPGGSVAPESPPSRTSQTRARAREGAAAADAARQRDSRCRARRSSRSGASPGGSLPRRARSHAPTASAKPCEAVESISLLGTPARSECCRRWSGRAPRATVQIMPTRAWPDASRRSRR